MYAHRSSSGLKTNAVRCHRFARQTEVDIDDQRSRCRPAPGMAAHNPVMTRSAGAATFNGNLHPRFSLMRRRTFKARIQRGYGAPTCDRRRPCPRGRPSR
jgi:hypothetical protein